MLYQLSYTPRPKLELATAIGLRNLEDSFVQR